MNNITKVSLAAVLFIGISSVVFCRDDLPYKKMHVLYSNAADTIYFVSSVENKEAEKEVGVGFLVLLKSNSEINTLFKYAAPPEHCDLEYYIGDLNKDKVNELMVLDGDEGFYDIRIYKITVEEDKYEIKKVYERDNVDVPTFRGKDFAVEKGKDGLPKIIFYTKGEEVPDAEFTVKYDLEKRKFIEIHDPQTLYMIKDSAE